jgi:hypothetical protein
MSSYTEPVPNIPTLAPVNVYQDDTQPLRDQLDHIYTDVSYVTNDKKRRSQYLLQEDITNDIWVQTPADSQDAPNPIYTLTLPTGALAAGANAIPHGIVTIGTLVDIRAVVTNGTTQRPIPYANPTAANSAAIDVDTNNVTITLGAGFGANYTGYIIMEYTKT